MKNMEFSRPSRGAVRLDGLRFDPERLRADVERLGQEPWHQRAYGSKWTDISLINHGEHPMLRDCPAFLEIKDAFPAPVLDMVLARIDAGGWIKEHRDFSGGTPMGVGRFHIPIVTDPKVEFMVDGDKLYLAPGEVWNLDTSYVHSVTNRSDVDRIHLIIDVRLNDAVRAMLPQVEWRDRLHKAHFAGLCVAKGVGLAFRDPRQLSRRMEDFVRLKVLGQSVLDR